METRTQSKRIGAVKAAGGSLGPAESGRGGATKISREETMKVEGKPSFDALGFDWSDSLPDLDTSALPGTSCWPLSPATDLSSFLCPSIHGGCKGSPPFSLDFFGDSEKGQFPGHGIQREASQGGFGHLTDDDPYPEPSAPKRQKLSSSLQADGPCTPNPTSYLPPLTVPLTIKVESQEPVQKLLTPPMPPLPPTPDYLSHPILRAPSMDSAGSNISSMMYSFSMVTNPVSNGSGQTLAVLDKKLVHAQSAPPDFASLLDRPVASCTTPQGPVTPVPATTSIMPAALGSGPNAFGTGIISSMATAAQSVTPPGVLAGQASQPMVLAMVPNKTPGKAASPVLGSLVWMQVFQPCDAGQMVMVGGKPCCLQFQPVDSNPGGGPPADQL